MRNCNAFLTITLFVFLTIPCGISIAAIDKFSPYAYTKVLYDSNLFRLSGDEEAIPAWVITTGMTRSGIWEPDLTPT